MISFLFRVNALHTLYDDMGVLPIIDSNKKADQNQNA